MGVFDNKFRKMNNSVRGERDSILEQDIQGSSIVLVTFHFTSIDCIIFVLLNTS